MKKNCENCAYNDNSSRLPPCLGCTASTTNPVPSNWEAGANYVADIKTNADRIRSMSDEKLLERLVTFCDCSYSCSGCLIEHECPVDDDKDTTVREDIENWLKAPCKED